MTAKKPAPKKAPYGANAREMERQAKPAKKSTTGTDWFSDPRAIAGKSTKPRKK